MLVKSKSRSCCSGSGGRMRGWCAYLALAVRPVAGGAQRVADE